MARRNRLNNDAIGLHRASLPRPSERRLRAARRAWQNRFASDGCSAGGRRELRRGPRHPKSRGAHGRCFRNDPAVARSASGLESWGRPPSIVGSCVQAVGAQSNRPTNGPSLAETKAWLESDGAALMKTIKINGPIAPPVSNGPCGPSSRVSNLTLSSCDLTYLQETTLRSFSKTPPSVNEKRGLKTDLCPAQRPGCRQHLGPQGVCVDGRARLLKFSCGLVLGAAYTMTSFSVGGDPVPREVALPVRDAHSGTRVADALRHATILCGATENVF